MKTVLTRFFAIGSIALLMLASCKKDEQKVVASPGKAGALQASATTIVMSKADVNNTAVTFTLTSANFGFKAAVTNVLQIDVKGDNFAKPKEYSLGTTALTQAFSVPDFNNLLLALNLPTGTASQVEARIKSQLSTNTAAVYSNTLSLSVTPFALIAYVYVPGAYQTPGPNWTPATADSLQSATANGVYTGIINFKDATDYNFKVTSDKKGTTWYGTLDGAVSGSGSAGNFLFTDQATVDPAVKIQSEQVVIDLNKNTIGLTPTLWSVVGDATPGSWPDPSGHQSDTDMKFNNATQTWSVVVALKPGGLKFRLNHAWDKNYGSVTTAGVLDTADNNNIPVTVAGNYLITVDIAHLTYTMVKQ